MENRKLNWRPSLPHINRVTLKTANLAESDLPQEVDLEPQFTPCYDQEGVGSCVDNAVGSLIERWLNLANYKWKFRPSRLFLYYNARSLEGTTDSDAGSTIADCVKATNEFGVCPEIEADGSNPDWIWTYVDDGVKFKTKPLDACYKDALLHKLLQDSIVPLDRNSVLNALAAGKPFAFGFSVHKSFMSAEMAQSGIMHIPSAFDFLDPIIGGHGVVAMGYKLNTPMGNQGVQDWVKIRNSWGTSWGQNGYFWMPLDQVLCNSDMASDAHAVELIGI